MKRIERVVRERFVPEPNTYGERRLPPGMPTAESIAAHVEHMLGDHGRSAWIELRRRRAAEAKEIRLMRGE